MSETAKGGFVTEDQVVDELNSWKSSRTAKRWLQKMGFNTALVDTVNAETTRSKGISSKADVVVSVNGGRSIGISVKKFTASFNQIDKRWVDNYAKIWPIPKDVIVILKKYCGQEGFRPIDMCVSNVKDRRRYFLTELTAAERSKILKFFNDKKSLIVHDVLRGEKDPFANYMLVIKRNGKGLEKSAIAGIDEVVCHYIGDVVITKKGNLKIGKITVQRKGGNGGGPTALNPVPIMNLVNATEKGRKWRRSDSPDATVQVLAEGCV